MRLGRFAQRGTFSRERRDLSFSQACAAVEQSLVRFARMPVELIDRPRHHGWLRERLDVLGLLAAQRFRERVARGREVGKRQLVEVVDASVESQNVEPGTWNLEPGTCYGCEIVIVKASPAAGNAPTWSATTTQYRPLKICPCRTGAFTVENEFC
jgi:hypothetical protein